ncbi:homeobox protein B-H1-like [Vespula maculifrons]|uniref:Homeobox protein B-H1-like n=1 Tax=Vespula maculifrons TaxID=7453 RepID=A0ABD2B0M6_VESMC
MILECSSRSSRSRRVSRDWDYAIKTLDTVNGEKEKGFFAIDSYRTSPGVATEAPTGARSPKEPPTSTVMTVHHHQNHHVAALSGVTVAGNGLNLSRMSGLEAHSLDNIVDRNGVGMELLSNGLDARNKSHNNNNNNNNNHSNSLPRGNASTTMPQRSRFMITDILASASSKVHPSGLPAQEPPGSPPSTPRDLSVRHQSKSSLSNSNLDEDSDASHHDGASVTSNGFHEGAKDIYGAVLPNRMFQSVGLPSSVAS